MNLIPHTLTRYCNPRVSILGIALGLGLSTLNVHASADDVAVPQPTRLVTSAEAISTQTAPVLPSELRTELQAIAKPKREASLRFPVMGQISRIHVTEGSQVETGTPLLTLDDRVQSAQVKAARVAAESVAGIRQAQISVERAKKALERVKQAHSMAASAMFEVEAKQNEYDQAQAQLVQQQEAQQTREAELELALANQAQHTLSSPFKGQVVLVAAKQGNTIEPGMVVVQIADLSLLEVALHLPGTLFGQIQAGQTITLIAGTPVNQTVPATVRYVSPVIEPTGATFLVRAEIDNQEARLQLASKCGSNHLL